MFPASGPDLRELAAALAVDPDLTVSIIIYQDGTAGLEVLRTGTSRPKATPVPGGDTASPEPVRAGMGLLRDGRLTPGGRPPAHGSSRAWHRSWPVMLCRAVLRWFPRRSRRSPQLPPGLADRRSC